MEERRDDLPPDVVDIAELLAEQVNFGAGAGETRIELVFKDGVLRYAYLHGRHDRQELRRRFRVTA